MELDGAFPVQLANKLWGSGARQLMEMLSDRVKRCQTPSTRQLTVWRQLTPTSACQGSYLCWQKYHLIATGVKLYPLKNLMSLVPAPMG